VAEPFFTPSGTPLLWRHGYTYSGHASVAAAALANLEIMRAEGLPARTATLESVLADRLAGLAKHPLVSEVRSGTGLLAAVQIDPDAIAADRGLPAKAAAALRAEGVLTRVLATGALQVSPPLVIEESEIDLLAGAMWEAFEQVA
jgi:adenosylmethionine-8-amino-7-oxononanoate aminotransferase